MWDGWKKGWGEGATLFDQQPIARTADPTTSHLAAESVAPANTELVDRIHRVLELRGRQTHEEIAEAVCASMPGRWTPGTVVSACARAELEQCGTTTNTRGRTVALWKRRET